MKRDEDRMFILYLKDKMPSLYKECMKPVKQALSVLLLCSVALLSVSFVAYLYGGALGVLLFTTIGCVIFGKAAASLVRNAVLKQRNILAKAREIVK